MAGVNAKVCRVFAVAMFLTAALIVLLYIVIPLWAEEASQVPHPQAGLRMWWGLTPTEAEKQFCGEGQRLLIVIENERLGQAKCSPAPEKKE